MSAAWLTIRLVFEKFGAYGTKAHRTAMESSAARCIFSRLCAWAFLLGWDDH
jgi:hypothetical protein